MTRVAFTWLVYERTQSPVALGLLMLCFTGPILVGGLLAGWALDRYDRRRLLILDCLLRGLVMAAIPLLAWMDQLALWHIYLAASVFGFLMMLPLAGFPSLIPDLVKQEDIAAANALEVMAYTLAGIAGPALAGFMIERLDAPSAVLIDVATYLFFAFLLFLSQLPRAKSHGEGSAGRGGLGEAAGLLWRQPVLLSTTVMYFFANLGMGGLGVWLPLVTDQWLGGGAQLFGLLMAALAVGELFGSFAAGAAKPSQALGRQICITQALTGASLLLMLVPLWPSVFAFVALLAFGYFSGPMTVFAQTLRMAAIPAPLRGRSFALIRTLIQSGNALGGLIAGAAVPLIGIGGTIALAVGFVGLPGGAGLAVKPLRDARAPSS